MRIKVTSKGFEVTSAITEAVEQRANLTLDRFRHAIRGVQVLLRDENGPRGGHDKRCSVQIELTDGQGTVAREFTHEDAYQAIAEAMARGERAIAGLLRRKRMRGREAEALSNG